MPFGGGGGHRHPPSHKEVDVVAEAEAGQVCLQVHPPPLLCAGGLDLRRGGCLARRGVAQALGGGTGRFDIRADGADRVRPSLWSGRCPLLHNSAVLVTDFGQAQSAGRKILFRTITQSAILGSFWHKNFPSFFSAKNEGKKLRHKVPGRKHPLGGPGYPVGSVRNPLGGGGGRNHALIPGKENTKVKNQIKNMAKMAKQK